MASFTLTSQVFPNGTKVQAVPKSNFPTPNLPSGAPIGPVTNEQTMTAGTLTFTGLTEGTEYWAVASVGGTYRYVGFVAAADIAQGQRQVEEVLATVNALKYKGATDCSSNPKFPKANAGDVYLVSVAGKIGGASGYTVAANDLFICNTDGAAEGTKGEVGSKWDIVDAQATVEAGVKVEKERAETAEGLKASKAELGTEKSERETADGERAKGPASSTDEDLAIFSGTGGKTLKDGGKTVAQVLARANHTGTQTASTISDLAAAVRELLQFTEKAASENLTLNTELKDIPNCSYTTPAAGTYLCIGIADINGTSASFNAKLVLLNNGVEVTGAGQFAAGGTTDRGMTVQWWPLVVAESGKVLKLQAKQGGGAYVVNAVNTKLLVLRVG